MHYNNRLQGIKKAKRLIRANANWKPVFEILIKTRVPCSCYMCGHRRKNFGKTHQEKKADLYLQDMGLDKQRRLC